MASANIIKYLKRKKSGSYEEPVYIGAEQRFISPLRGTNNNNLEEQNILGLDCITTSYWKNSVLYEIREFRDTTKTNNYYVMKSQIYDSGSMTTFSILNTTVQWVGDVLQFTSDRATFDTNGSFLVINGDASFDTSGTLIIAEKTESDGEEGSKMVRQDILYYINASGNEIKVSTKKTFETVEDGTTVTKYIITNHL